MLLVARDDSEHSTVFPVGLLAYPDAIPRVRRAVPCLAGISPNENPGTDDRELKYQTDYLVRNSFCCRDLKNSQPVSH